MAMDIILAGVGGQGTLLASKIIAHIAMAQGNMVRTAETIGMAQRGGSVTSHVRTGQEVYSPLSGKGQAKLILGFEPGEAVRCLPYLAPGGTVVAADRAIQPVTGTLGSLAYDSGEMLNHLRDSAGRLVVLDVAQLEQEAGSIRALNMALLGAAVAAGMLGCTLEDLESAVKELVKPQYFEANCKAIALGARAVS